MKKLSILLLSFLLILPVSGQVKTVVSGKISSNQDSQVGLSVHYFSDETLSDKETNLTASVTKDGEFIFITDTIDKPFTECELSVHGQELKIILSPGDSLHINLDYWAVTRNPVFVGRDSAINSYWHQQNARFEETQRVSWIYSGTEKNIVPAIKVLFREKEALLNEYDSRSFADTTFYNHEKKRLEFQYYAYLLYRSTTSQMLGDEAIQEIRNVAGRINLNDREALLNYKDFRSYITRYIGFLADSTGRSDNVYELFDLVDKNCSGLIHTYFCCQTLTKTIRDANQKEKRALLKYVRTRYAGTALIPYLDQIERQYTPSRYDFSTKPLTDTLTVSLILFAGIALLLIYRKKRPKKNPRFNSAALLLILITPWVFYLVNVALFEHEPFGDSAISWIVFLIFLVYFVIHLIWFIPRISAKYTVLGTIIRTMPGYLLYCAVICLVPRWMVQAGWFNSNMDIEYWISCALITGFSVILLSYFYHHLIILARKNLPLGNLFSRSALEPERSLNLIFVFTFLTITIDKCAENGSFWTLLTVLCGIIPFYLFTFYFIPDLLFKKKYLSFAVQSALTLLLVTALIITADTLSSYFWIHQKGIPVSPGSLISVPGSVWIILVVFPALIYAFLRKYLLDQRNEGYSLYRNKEAELQQLRSQVNPHFLFNSLNTVYAFALKENNAKTAEYIAKLASLMRYLIEDMEKEKIPVEKEIEYIRDYINMQKIRSSVEHVIDIKTDIQRTNFQIAPMLMIPFVENAFKHGMNPNKISELMISIQVSGHQFIFETENSFDRDFKTFYKEKGFGIGIENVRQRLQYIYPGQHTLYINKSDDRFTVKMTIG